VPKHSGADWMSRMAKVPFSPLGVRVANVLGQMGKGIYHYQNDLFDRRAPQWQREDEIAVSLYGELATIDGCELSSLLMCCQAAGLTVEVFGHSHDLVHLAFTQREMIVPDPTPELVEGCSLEAFWEHHRLIELSPADMAKLARKQLPTKSRIRHFACWTPGVEGVTNICFSVPNYKVMGRIYQLAVDAHQARIRLAISGLSPSSVELQITRRPSRDGPFYDRHPTWDSHRELLKPYWDIDYDSLR